MFLALLSSVYVHAAQIVAIDTLLEQPLEQRLSLVARLNRAQVNADLVRAAFDAVLPLRTRWRAVTTMGKWDASYFKASIERAARAPEWFMRNAALIAQLNDDRDRAVAAAVRALDDPALIVRTQAVRNLIHFDARSTSPRLWRALREAKNYSPGGESLWIRPHLAEALARFATPGRATELRALLEDADESVAAWGVRGLERAYGMSLDAPGDTPARAKRRWLARLGNGIT